MTSAPSPASAGPRPRAVPRLVLAVCCAIYAVLVASHWNRGYIDFGDGNYIYIAWRMAEGVTIYRDILAPQPPMHLVTGMWLVKLSALLGTPMIFAFRAFSLLLHVATAVLVYAGANRLARHRHAEPAVSQAPGAWAAAIYLLLPLGFWWGMGYQSEPLEMVFFMSAFVLFLRWTRPAMVAAGVLMALATLTNMSAAPYTLFCAGYLAVRRPRLLAAYLVPCVALLVGVAVVMEARTGAYMENVILNQVGSFPRAEFLPAGQTLFTYAWGKVVREGMDVFILQGGFVVLALMGLLRYARRGEPTAREFSVFYGFFAMCSILYVSKGGTMDYIFTIGEPFVAIFAGLLLWHFWRKHMAGWTRRLSWGDWTPVAVAMTLAALAVVMMGRGLSHSWATLKQRTYELDEHASLRVADTIRRNVPPDGLVLAPPFYAVLAERRIVEDYSEVLLWQIKYHNEVHDGVRGRGVETTERVAEMLRQRRVDFVVLDLDQTGSIRPIREAIDAAYEPARTTELRTLNTRLMFYRPKAAPGDAATTATAAN